MTATGTSPETKPDKTSKATAPRHREWFRLPDPIRRVFDHFPLRTYDENILPQRSPKRRKKHVLHIFTLPKSTRRDHPSCNPACLKWQAFLKFCEIDFETTTSNNHASPTGSLPFILPAYQSQSRPTSPIPASKISKWASSYTGHEELSEMKQEAYSSLVDHGIRNAWLYSLYLDESNFESVARRLYISTASSNQLVQASLAHQLRIAARDELLKNNTMIDGNDLYVEAENAFAALSILLGTEKTFSKSERPGLLDASVFAYTYLLLSEELGWKTTKLSDIVRSRQNLVEHRQHLSERYFPSVLS